MADKKAPTPELNVDVQAAVIQHRRQQAQNREQQAMYQEVEARRWEKVKGHDPKLHGVEHQRMQFRDSRDKYRKEADEMHKLAGTKKEDFREEILTNLRGMRYSFEQSYVGAVDAEENPQAYGSQGPVGGMYPAYIWAYAIEALEEVVAEVEKWGATPTPARAPE